MRRKIKYFALLIIIVCISVPVDNMLNSTENEEKWGSFTAEKTYSYDGKYYAECEPELFYESELTRRMCVDIWESETKEKVFSFYPARSWDFWGICWESDSYHIWIQSGDTGVFCYLYKNGVWQMDYSADRVRPENIVSKYDVKYGGEQ